MSYDLAISVKVEGCDKYAMIAEPEHSSPTYNLRDMFVACMDWDFETSEEEADGKYRTVYYNCKEVISKVERGIKELRLNRIAYLQYIPQNGWGSIESAIAALESLRECIYEEAEDIPIECLWMNW